MLNKLGELKWLKKLSKPIIIISLDTELLWGYVAYPTLKAVTLMKNDSRKDNMTNYTDAFIERNRIYDNGCS
jgi:hypothetical protein